MAISRQMIMKPVNHLVSPLHSARVDARAAVRPLTPAHAVVKRILRDGGVTAGGACTWFSLRSFPGKAGIWKA
jgi:hypothetical protein